MGWLFGKKKKKDAPTMDMEEGASGSIQELVKTQVKTWSLHEAHVFLCTQIDERGFSDNPHKQLSMDETSRLTAGDAEIKSQTLAALERYIEKHRIQVTEFNQADLAEYVFNHSWDAGPIQEFKDDDSVIEVRCNRFDRIYVKYVGGRKIRLPKEKCFVSDEAVKIVVDRMLSADTGSSLTQSTPIVESVLPDGSRLSATSYPTTTSTTFVLRKHKGFVPSKESYMQYNSLNDYGWDMLETLVKGRAGMLFNGNVEAGKTTLMRTMIQFLIERLRVLVLGRDNELRVADAYDGDIWEAEEHKECDPPVTIEILLETALRFSGDVIIMEEFRSAGEVYMAVNAANRGMFGTMATCHFSTPRKAVRESATLMISNGLNLPISRAEAMFAEAFPIVVQMYGDSVTGVKKVISITELIVDGYTDKVSYKTLLSWQPNSDDYFGNGEWVKGEDPSSDLLYHMLKFTSRDSMTKLGWNLNDVRYGA